MGTPLLVRRQARKAAVADPRLIHLGNGETRSIDPTQVVNVGARDLDDEDRTLMRASGMRVCCCRNRTPGDLATTGRNPAPCYALD